jgi:hypothetical protein
MIINIYIYTQLYIFNHLIIYIYTFIHIFFIIFFNLFSLSRFSKSSIVLIIFAKLLGTPLTF